MEKEKMFELEGTLLELDEITYVGKVYQGICNYYFSCVIDTQFIEFRGDTEEQCKSIHKKLCEALVAK